MDSSIDLCQLPAAPAPDGHSNFETSTSLGPALLGVMAVTVAWGIIFTAARLYINIRKLVWADCKFRYPWIPISPSAREEHIYHTGCSNGNDTDFNLIALFTAIAILGVESTRKPAQWSKMKRDIKKRVGGGLVTDHTASVNRTESGTPYLGCPSMLVRC